MAEKFDKWLEKYVGSFGSNASFVVASIIGKETSDNTKTDVLNRYLGKEIFLDSWDCEESLVSVDAYLDEGEKVLWLLPNGLYDLTVQHHLFGTGTFDGKAFFERINVFEQLQLKLLSFIFSISHLVLFVSQDCRFDLDWIRTLDFVNKRRQNLLKDVKLALAEKSANGREEVEQFPRYLFEAGRVALPRLLFCFYRNPLRIDLSAAKKKELLEKMEKCLENQISHILKQHGIVDNRLPDNALGQITISSGVPFVYIFTHSELPKDRSSEFVLALFPDESNEFCSDVDVPKLIEDHLELRPKDKEKLNRANYNFDYFLHNALSNIHKEIASKTGGKRQLPAELVSLDQFVSSASCLKSVLLDEGDVKAETIKCTPELDTIDSLVQAAIRSGIALYSQQLSQQPEITGGGDIVFSRLEHDFTRNMALEQLQKICPKAAGLERREWMGAQLKAECELFWLDGHQRCEQLSLTGQLCHYAIHETEGVRIGEQARSRSKTSVKKHCSGVKTFSMCNCGMTRQIRIDPFTLKEANYDFYCKTDFDFGSCCAELDRYEFHLFDPKNATLPQPNPDLRPVQTRTSEDVQRQQTLATKTMADKTLWATPKMELDDDDGLAINPEEFNIRFFDDEDEEILSTDEEATTRGKAETSEAHPATQEDVLEKGLSEGELSSDDEEEEDEEEEEERRKKLVGQGSTEEEEERANCSQEAADYLDSYDTYPGKEHRSGSMSSGSGGVGKDSQERHRQRMDETQVAETYQGLFLDHVPHSNSPPDLLPLFPSFSVVCIGHSSLYNHSTGIRNCPNFRSGSEFLLPWDVQLVVKTEQWLRELQYIGATPSERTFRNLQHQQKRFEKGTGGTSKEKVKMFIGFDYECPRGHRFMVSEPGKVLRHRRTSGPLKLDAMPLMENDLPIWMPCPCKKEPRTSAQLMRIHIVTPKAPVSVVLQPAIQMADDDGGFFQPGASERIELGWAKYYVMRLPYAYTNPSGKITHRPSIPEFKGRLIRHCISVNYLPLANLESSF